MPLITPPSSAANSIRSRSPTPPQPSMGGHSSSGKKHHESSRGHGRSASHSHGHGQSPKDGLKESSQTQGGHSSFSASSTSSPKPHSRGSGGSTHRSKSHRSSSENTSGSPSSKTGGKSSGSGSSRHGHDKKAKQQLLPGTTTPPPPPSSESSSLAEASLAAATAAAAATEAVDGFYGENGEYYGCEYYSDYANHNYYYNYYYGQGASEEGGDHGVNGVGEEEDDGEDEDGHRLMARLMPGMHRRDREREADDILDDGDDDDQHQHQQRQHAAREETDSDECYPASVTSSVRNHVHESGLRYHAFHGSGGGGGGGGMATHAGKMYALPNDDVEQNRDDMKHTLSVLLMKGKQFYAPVHDKLAAGAEVYDLGTGTGIWAIELADNYPNATIRGVDLSPIQPNFVPDNVFFAVDDFEDDWIHPPNQFDYIHMRHALFAVEDRPALLRKIFRHLKPGGYVEFQELQPVALCDDSTLTDSTPYALRDFFRFVGHGMKQSPVLAGGDLIADQSQSHARRRPLSETLSGELRHAGFRGVRAATHKCPLGVWPRDRRLLSCGLLMRTALMDGLRGWATRPLGHTAGGLGWTTTQIEVFLVDVRKAIMDSSVHTYFPLHVVYAQKPKE